MRAGEVERQNRQQDRESRNKERQDREGQNKEEQIIKWQSDSRLSEGLHSEGGHDEETQEEDWREEERREQERQRRRRQRIEEMKREKQRREMMIRYGVPGVAVVAVLCVVLLIVGIVKAVRPKDAGGSRGEGSSGVASFQEDMSDSEGSGQKESGSEGSRPEGNGQEGSGPEGSGQKGLSVWHIAHAGELFALGSAQAGGFSAMGDMAYQDGVSDGTQPDAPKTVFEAHTTENTNGFSDSIISEYGILIDVESGEVLAQKGGWNRISPASMTKILTILVAAEHITDLEDTFTMIIDITDYSFVNDCSNVGFSVGEVIPLRDLFYGTALQSGADAALGLAYYVAGSQEAFVEMMNEKLEELGLSETTHFTNCVGLYDEDHYSTPYDMAVILKEATDNEFCRQVLSEHHYVTTPTAEHPEGIDISNWFLRRIEDRDTHGEVLCAKTGYVVQSKNCAASLAADHSGREYICVTASSDSTWTCIRDQVELYQRYLPE